MPQARAPWLSRKPSVAILACSTVLAAQGSLTGITAAARALSSCNAGAESQPLTTIAYQPPAPSHFQTMPPSQGQALVQEFSIRPAIGTSSRPRTPISRLYPKRRTYPCQSYLPTLEFDSLPPSNVLPVRLLLEYLPEILAWFATPLRPRAVRPWRRSGIPPMTSYQRHCSRAL